MFDLPVGRKTVQRRRIVAIFSDERVLANLTVHIDDVAGGIVHRGFREQPVSRPERSGHNGEGGWERDDAVGLIGTSNGSAAGQIEDGDPVLYRAVARRRSTYGVSADAQSGATGSKDESLRLGRWGQLRRKRRRVSAKALIQGRSPSARD
ncbi:hypothetical protein CSOJ01_04065 [Colletotrichum sojae]|uniref:Uncharacterized protein n=1 Tax=Colletotrichum sojae TaxID=2175907 RepID=A0A8H6JK04_9PEZI|nr:hypothetical protein CSOJ01_04065 [Colletotrichum sojae]